MENTLRVGDLIVMSKLHYGPRLSFSALGINWNCSGSEKLNGPAKDENFKYNKYKRLKGLTKISRNDIIIFDFAYKQDNTFLIKRCIGLPGEEITIKNEKVYCDNVIVNNPIYSKNRYKVYGDIEKICPLVDSLSILYSENQDCIKLDITTEQFKYLNRISQIDSIIYSNNKSNLRKVNIENSLPDRKLESYDPILIPKKGLSIKMNKSNYLIFHDILKIYEGNSFELIDSMVICENNIVRDYIFKYNYYFVMGDNRCHSLDSRTWGFLPEHAIIGKALFILYNRSDRKFHWDRFFRGIK